MNRTQDQDFENDIICFRHGAILFRVATSTNFDTIWVFSTSGLFNANNSNTVVSFVKYFFLNVNCNPFVTFFLSITSCDPLKLQLKWLTHTQQCDDELNAYRN